MKKFAVLRLVPLVVLSVGCAPEVSAAAASPASTGPMTVRVDARDVPQMVLHSKLHIPVRSGQVTLVYPKFIPGNHGPTGTPADIAGLRFSAGGKPLAWKRDPELTSEFTMTVPAGSEAVDVDLDVVVDVRWSETQGLSDINWNRMVLYPKGARVHDLQVHASVELPQGWHHGTSLPVASANGAALDFKQVSLETLVDSPLVMGRYGRTIDLGTVLGAPHALELVAETKNVLSPSDKQIAAYKKLVAEAAALFGARHYDSYTFLYMLSGADEHRGSGLEHHASSQNLGPASVFLSDDTYRSQSNLLSHEFSHSWCGKYRRPKGLATPDYQQPMRNDLLWVYEGLTDYFGWLLGARSGIATTQDAKDELGGVASMLDSIPGRRWRPLADTQFQAALIPTNREMIPAQRSADYYPESLLIWLEADTIIRQKTGNQRSLDDFARAFFGGQNTGPEVRPYELADVLKALNDVAPYDWKGFVEQRVTDINPRAPMGGIEGAGYKLVYRDKPTEGTQLTERLAHRVIERFTLGAVFSESGQVQEIYLDGPAAQAGLSQGATVIAVNGRKFSREVLRTAIADNKGGGAPIELIAERDGFYRTHRVNWNQGLRFAVLERDPSKPDLLTAIIHPRS